MTQLQSDLDLAVRAVRAGLAVAASARTRDVVEVKAHAADLLTATDLAAEAAIRSVLAESPLPVQGEEGSPELVLPDRWIVDPIDGTANFVADLPLVASTVAQARGGVPVLGATGDVTTGRVVWASTGGGAWQEGPDGVARCRTYVGDLRVATVTVGDLSWTNSGPWSMSSRARVLHAVAGSVGRLRVIGTSATELAWVATGRSAASVLYGNHPWDVAAGVVAVREAGGVVLDLHGAPWSFASDSVLAAANTVVAEALLAAIRGAGAAA